MANSKSGDWKGYIGDDAGQADKPTSLYSMGAVIRTGINGLKGGHKNLVQFKTHVQGIDHTTANTSRRLTKNLEANAMFDGALQPIKQHDRTIVDAVERRAELEKLLASAAKLIKDQADVNDPANPMDHDAKKVEIERLRDEELRYYTEKNRLLTDICRGETSASLRLKNIGSCGKDAPKELMFGHGTLYQTSKEATKRAKYKQVVVDHVHNSKLYKRLQAVVTRTSTPTRKAPSNPPRIWTPTIANIASRHFAKNLNYSLDTLGGQLNCRPLSCGPALLDRSSR